MKTSGKGGHPSSSFVAGSVALLFLIIGYQAALFIHKASVARIVANHDDRPPGLGRTQPQRSEDGLGRARTAGRQDQR